MPDLTTSSEHIIHSRGFPREASSETLAGFRTSLSLIFPYNRDSSQNVWDNCPRTPGSSSKGSTFGESSEPTVTAEAPMRNENNQVESSSSAAEFNADQPEKEEAVAVTGENKMTKGIRNTSRGSEGNGVREPHDIKIIRLKTDVGGFLLSREVLMLGDWEQRFRSTGRPC